MLTRKQHQLLAFIHQRLEATGISPSFEEMKDALGLKSKSGIHRLITALEERGFIRRLPHRARALEILRMPDGSRPAAGAGPEKRRGFLPTVISGSVLPGRSADRGDGEAGRDFGPRHETISLPLHGRIAAGTPIEALQDNSTMVEVPSELLGSGEHYALTVSGDSMVDAGILDGDTVILRSADTADDGSIVVALIDDYEATLKRLRRRGDRVALEAANPDYETRIFGAGRVKIQGRLVGLIRRYN